jgi:signal transduction histidine kinase
MIERQAGQMKRLLDDLLEVSRITRGAIELRPEAMRLDGALRDAVEAAQPAFEAKRLRLQLQLPREPMPLVADPVRLAQVLGNLLTNACKYTPEGGRVRVEAEQDAAGATVHVIDDGIGIAADQLEAVFGLFVQAEPGVGPYQGGLGIGLALVRRLVQMHGGHVHAASAGPGRGATFTLWLPRG